MILCVQMCESVTVSSKLDLGL